jgi:hypothetical protein
VILSAIALLIKQPPLFSHGIHKIIGSPFHFPGMWGMKCGLQPAFHAPHNPLGGWAGDDFNFVKALFIFGAPS